MLIYFNNIYMNFLKLLCPKLKKKYVFLIMKFYCYQIKKNLFLNQLKVVLVKFDKFGKKNENKKK